jgi:hypothetical protein
MVMIGNIYTTSVYAKHPNWGLNAKQKFKEGCFMKVYNTGIVSVGVQPNKDKTSPVGYTKLKNGKFIKNNIIIVKYLKANQRILLKTLDGWIFYNITEPSVIVAQTDENNCANLNDVWKKTISSLKKDYYYE